MGGVTVLNGARSSVLGAFMPKPRPAVPRQAYGTADRPRRSLRDRLRGRGRSIKDGLVATAAFGSGTVAAFEWHPWAGWLAIGLSLLLIDHSVDRSGANGSE